MSTPSPQTPPSSGPHKPKQLRSRPPTIKKEYQEITVTKDICTNLTALLLLLFLVQLLSQEPQMRKKNQLLYSIY